MSLHAAGYRTGFMGKYLNGYRAHDETPPGWDEWDATGNGYPEYNYPLNENGTQHRYGHRPGDYLTDVLSQKAGAFIDSAATQPAAVHARGRDVRPALPLHRRAAVRPHATRACATRARPGSTRSRPTRRRGSRAARRSPPRSRRDIDRAYRQRVRADLAVDDLIAHLQDRLRADGVAGNTYFVFSSDNGYHMGENRLLPGKQTAFDTDVHVPLVVSGPGVPGRAHRRASWRRTSTSAPPSVDLTGTAIPRTVDGVSLAPAVARTARPRPGSRPSWSSTTARTRPERPRPWQPPRPATRRRYSAVRTANALYVRYADGEQEYYDTARDPYELHNLARRGVPADLPAALAALRTCRGATQCQAAARLP